MTTAASFVNLDSAQATLEKNVFNKAGYIPLVSTVSGILRQKLGLIQVVSSIAMAIFFAVQSLFLTSPREINAAHANAKHCLSYALHGIANMFRGGIESIPLLGNAVVYGYDYFEARVGYKTEPQNLRDNPLYARV